MDTRALDDYLHAIGVSRRGELHVALISGGKSNLTFKAVDDESAWVVRRPPTSGLTPSAHDMAREWAVTSALTGTEVPVARTVAFDPDGLVLGAPMTVVEFQAGRVIRSRADLDDLTDAQIDANARELVQVLARLHAVDFRAVGLGEFGRPEGFVARQVSTWFRQWQRVKTRDLPDVDALHAGLEAGIPAWSDAAIVHGDYRVDNTILASDDVGSVLAVVDWEMSTLGDPLADLALMCTYRQPLFDVVLGEPAAWTSERYPSADTLVELYAAESGRTIAHWNFYLALANFKLAIIAEGITHRALQGSNAGTGAHTAAHATSELAAAGLRAIRPKHTVT
jgi:aminoglycoside phosphotransferase (APT) family kinase protein